MDTRPSVPAPLRRFIKNVSIRSSRVCASATFVKPCLLTNSAKNSFRLSRPAASTDGFTMETLFEKNGMANFSARLRVKLSSSSDAAPRSP